ncbi:MAG: hypothetical protein J1G01_04375 [Clostridiales bacterium]|nr:hypothetical protein [Clostridiales bacterium]
MKEEQQRVTGKKVLLDAVTLAKDTGTYIFELSKRAYRAIKSALCTKNDEQDNCPKTENAQDACVQSVKA